MNLHVPPQPPKSPFQMALEYLAALGTPARPTGGIIPGLYEIDGYPELTTNQVVSVAVQKGMKLPGPS